MSIDDSEQYEADGMLQGDALIMANFHIDPGAVEPEKWAKLFAQAVWLENYRLNNLAKLLAAMYGEQ